MLSDTIWSAGQGREGARHRTRIAGSAFGMRYFCHSLSTYWSFRFKKHLYTIPPHLTV